MTNIDIDSFKIQYARFINYSLSKSGETEFVSFKYNQTTEEQEGYKDDIYDLGREKLDFYNWDRKLVGTGELFAKTVNALRLEENLNNLVDWRLVDKYATGKLFDNQLSELEQALFNLYKNTVSDQESFTEITKLLGKNYPIIAYFFFLKDNSRYMPISTERFDIGFEMLGVEDFKTSKQCSWENYQQYNLLLKEVQTLLIEMGISGASLLNAHSFVWIISDPKVTTSEILDKRYKAPSQSEAIRTVVGRIGQEICRAKARLLWKDECSVTDCKELKFLAASHIKPWAACTNAERFDETNLLLLTPNLHQAFDDGYICFDISGKIIISQRLDSRDAEELGITTSMKLKELPSGIGKYLKYHYENIFIN
jgi:hypothetical protein